MVTVYAEANVYTQLKHYCKSLHAANEIQTEVRGMRTRLQMSMHHHHHCVIQTTLRLYLNHSYLRYRHLKLLFAAFLKIQRSQTQHKYVWSGRILLNMSRRYSVVANGYQSIDRSNESKHIRSNQNGPWMKVVISRVGLGWTDVVFVWISWQLTWSMTRGGVSNRKNSTAYILLRDGIFLVACKHYCECDWYLPPLSASRWRCSFNELFSKKTKCIKNAKLRKIRT